MARTVVIGLDGASWNLLRPWMGAGRLPNLARLVRNASAGDLLSTLPAVTYPAWKAYSTGKNPGKLGAYWWLHVDWRARRILPNTSRSFRSPELWDVLNARGLTTGVMNMPTCYPPRPLNGFMVAGCIAPEGRPFTSPPGLERELKRKFGYRLKPAKYFGDGASAEEVARDVMDVTERRFDAALGKMGDVDFLHLTVFYIDDLQHYLYDDDLVREAWERIDARLAPLVDDASLNLVVMSDHGFTRLRTNFHVNRWLEDRGHLVTRTAAYETAYRLGLNHDRLNRWGRALRLDRVVPARVKEWTWRALPNEKGRVTETARERKIDWSRSRAIANGEGPVYVNPDLPDRDAFVEALREEMLADADLGPHLAAVHRREEIYAGPYVHLAPDLLLVPREGVELTGVLGAKDLTGIEPGGWVGCHRPEGIAVLRFPGAEPVKLEGARLIDLMPTLAALHDAPIPEDVDGRVLDAALPRDARRGVA